MDVDLSGVESAIQGISTPDMNGIENAIGNLDTSIGDTLERMCLLAVCVAGAIVGWRKVLAALAVFIVYELLSGNNAESPLKLFIAILIGGTVRWIWRWLRGRFKKKTAAATKAANG